MRTSETRSMKEEAVGTQPLHQINSFVAEITGITGRGDGGWVWLRVLWSFHWSRLSRELRERGREGGREGERKRERERRINEG